MSVHERSVLFRYLLDAETRVWRCLRGPAGLEPLDRRRSSSFSMPAQTVWASKKARRPFGKREIRRYLRRPQATMRLQHGLLRAPRSQRISRFRPHESTAKLELKSHRGTRRQSSSRRTTSEPRARKTIHNGPSEPNRPLRCLRFLLFHLPYVAEHASRETQSDSINPRQPDSAFVAFVTFC